MGVTAKEEFCELLNDIIKRKLISKDWNTDITTPMFKKGGAKICSNYRGFALTYTPSKVLIKRIEISY